MLSVLIGFNKKSHFSLGYFLMHVINVKFHHRLIITSASRSRGAASREAEAEGPGWVLRPPPVPHRGNPGCQQCLQPGPGGHGRAAQHAGARQTGKPQRGGRQRRRGCEPACSGRPARRRPAGVRVRGDSGAAGSVAQIPQQCRRVSTSNAEADADLLLNHMAQLRPLVDNICAGEPGSFSKMCVFIHLFQTGSYNFD